MESVPLKEKDIKEQSQISNAPQKKHAGQGGENSLAVKAVGDQPGDYDAHTLQGCVIQQKRTKEK